MTQRRHFIQILPFAGVALLTACSEKAPVPAAVPVLPPPAPAPTPPPAPAPTPAAAPVSPPPAAAAPAPAAATGPVTESDPTAASLGYVADASRADAAKYKNYVAGQACSNCSLYTGKAGDATGPCAIFAGRAVAAKGWCSAYVKKAG